jgi:hypothetical protein
LDRDSPPAAAARPKRVAPLRAELLRLVDRIESNDPTLTEANLGGFPTPDHGFERLGQSLLSNTHLTHLLAHNTNMTTAGLRHLLAGLGPGRNLTLKALNLGENWYTEEGMAVLIAHLRENPAIVDLYVDAHATHADAKAALRAVLDPAAREQLWIKTVGHVPPGALDKTAHHTGCRFRAAGHTAADRDDEMDCMAAPEPRGLPASAQEPPAKKTAAVAGKARRTEVALTFDQALSPAEQLLLFGVTVVPCLDPVQLPQIRREFDDMLHSFPEFLPTATEYVMGGFAALGNPASFHAPLVRRMREWVMVAEVENLWRDYTRRYQPDALLEKVSDRILFRRKGRAPTAEVWHRDEAPRSLKGDEVFGGWLNLDNHPQYFNCVPGTHKDVPNANGGFHVINDPAATAQYARDCRVVEVPPGHVLVFFEHIVHEVRSKKAAHDMYRMSTGWRLTTSSEPLFGREDTERRLALQDVMPLKSGQMPPMYAKRHWTNFTDSIALFSAKNIRPELLVDQEMKSGAREGQVFRVVPRVMPSLAEAGLPLYPPYTAEEKATYYPARQWTGLLVPGSNTVRRDLSLADPLQELLQLCTRPTIETFETAFADVAQLEKIGEGSFAEIFIGTQDDTTVAYKIMPFNGAVNHLGHPQQSISDIVGEVTVALELNELQRTSGAEFNPLHEVFVCRGRFHAALVAAWDRYVPEHEPDDEDDETRRARMMAVSDDQLFVVMVSDRGGSNLWSHELDRGEDAISVLAQVTVSLAVAEEALEFEHRDLHQGNLLLTNVVAFTPKYTFEGGKVVVLPESTLEVDIIDFTLSRLLGVRADRPRHRLITLLATARR